MQIAKQEMDSLQRGIKFEEESEFEGFKLQVKDQIPDFLKKCRVRLKKLSKASLSQHLKKQDKLVEKCQVCDEILKNGILLKSHLVSIHQFHECEICSKIYPAKNSLLKHKYKYHRLPCEHCDQTFSSNILLSQHHKEGHGKCHCCNQLFGDMLSHHLASVHKFLKCPLCPRLYANKRKLINHKSNHRVKCKKCYNVFGSRKLLRQHTSEKHGTTKTKCQVCDQVLSKNTFEKHLITLHNFEECKYCSKLSVNKKSLERHIYIYHRVKCEHCDKTFRSKALLDQHLTEVILDDHMNEPINHLKCQSCSKHFANEEELRDHQLLQHPIKCELCDDVFITKALLTQHTEKHSFKPRNCYFCNEILDNEAMFETHLIKAHNFVRCEICAEMYATQSMYDAHKTTRHPVKCDEVFNNNIPLSILCHNHEQKCKLCNETLDRDSLEIHLLETHKFVRCENCSKMYVSQRALEEHIISQHPVKCEHCDEVYTSKKLLDQHLIVKHTLQCQVCSEFLNNEILLENHLASVHEFVECEICSKLFANFEALRRHKGIEHPVQCVICAKIFKSNTSLSRHNIEQHGQCIRCHRFLGRNLDKHLLIVHKYIRCKQCSKVLPKARLSSHISNMHRNKCKLCGEVFVSKILLTQHNSEKHGNPETKPIVSQQSLADDGEHSSESGDEDMNVDSFEIGKHECDQCEAHFESYHERILHIEKEHFSGLRSKISNKAGMEIDAEQHFQCDICNMGFEFAGDFEKHSKDHISKVENLLDS